MKNTDADKSRQMAREFKIGITILAVLSCAFLGVAYRHYYMSFTEPPSKFRAQASRTDSANEAPQAAPKSKSQTLGRFELKEETASYEPPPYEETSRNSSFQAPPPVLPPPAELNVESSPGKMPLEHREFSGGSFQTVRDLDDNSDSTSQSLASPLSPSGGSSLPTPSEVPLTSPRNSAPATIELAPPNRTEPATFQHNPDEPETVQRTQFQVNETRDENRRGLAHLAESSEQNVPVPPTPNRRPANADSQLPAAAPLNLAIDGSSKPIDRSIRVSTIRADDSFWLISQRAYGNGNYFRALYEHNRKRFPEPDRLPVGAPVEIPSVDLLRRRFPDFCPKADGRPSAAEKKTADSGRLYTVVGGETLFDVARFQLGQGSRYVEILELNRDVLKGDADALPPGLRLRLPPR